MDMKKTATLTLLIFTGLLLTRCTDNAKPEIEKTLEAFYETHRTEYRKADQSLLSKSLAELITRAAAREDKEAEKVKNSENPTEKPMMIEGDIFTSVYEGQNAFTVKEITVNGDQATAKVDFKNTSDNIAWQDEVVLINENGWKIDNVLFKNPDMELKNTKEVLSSLINEKE